MRDGSTRKRPTSTQQPTWMPERVHVDRWRRHSRLSEVYGKGFGVETYFDEIVSIGARIVKIIEEHAGHARPEEKDVPEGKDLMIVFAKYLAHFAVLKHLHDEAKTTLTGGKAADVGTKVDLSAVFPEELHTLINEGFEAISRDIERWRQKAAS